MSWPSVTCVMTAYNYARYVAGALQSVLTQDYPPHLLDVIVVDDGSTDGTADVVRRVGARSDGRVTLVRQANAGLAAATQAALDRSGGELIAICDADDEWLPGKVRCQVEFLRARPEVSLVYGDMQVIDESGSLLDASFFRRQNVSPRRGRTLDELVAVNFTTNSTLMLRARDLVAIPAQSPYADYWLVMHAAAVGELELVERPLANYRLHGSNMSFGAAGDREIREARRELMIRRLILSGDVGDHVAPRVLAAAVLDLHGRAHAISRTAGLPLADVLPVSEAQRRRAEAELEGTFAEPDPERRLRARALAWLLDPLSEAAGSLIGELAPAPLVTAQAPARTPGPGSHPPRRVTVASAAELIAHPHVIAEYCARMAPVSDATLVIVADPHELEGTATRLRVAMEEVGVDPDACPDMAIVPASELRTIAGRSLLGRAARLTPCPELVVSDAR